MSIRCDRALLRAHLRFRFTESPQPSGRNARNVAPSINKPWDGDGDELSESPGTYHGSHLSELYAREINGKRLGTEYAFARPSAYRLKAVLQTEGGTVESGVLEIDIREPQGVDRSIWEVLREDPELGYFIQSGGPKGPPETPRSQQLEATLERLVGSFPEGRQAEGIRAGLAEYRALLEELRSNQLPDDELLEE